MFESRTETTFRIKAIAEALGFILSPWMSDCGKGVVVICRLGAACGGGRVGLRRRFKAPISSEARVRIPSFALFDVGLISTGLESGRLTFGDGFLRYYAPIFLGRVRESIPSPNTELGRSRGHFFLN